MKLILAIVSLSLVLGAHAQARMTKSFVCTSKLDYIFWKNGQPKIRTINFKVNGERSQTNTLAGGSLVEVGNYSFRLHLPRHELSDSVVILRGTNAKVQASLSFVFMKNSDGSDNLSNAVSVSVRHYGYLLTATNEILGTQDTSDAYPIHCSIE